MADNSRHEPIRKRRRTGGRKQVGFYLDETALDKLDALIEVEDLWVNRSQAVEEAINLLIATAVQKHEIDVEASVLELRRFRNGTSNETNAPAIES